MRPSRSNLLDAYGTPISTSAISKMDDNLFDFEEEAPEEEPRAEDLPFVSPRTSIHPASKVSAAVRFGVHSTSNSSSKDFTVARIWHADNLYKTVEDNELGNITSYKSTKVTTSSKAREICNVVAAKLVIDDASKYRLYTVKQKSKKPIKDDELLYPIATAPDVKIAFLVSSGDDEEETEINQLVGVNAFSGDLLSNWEPLACFVTAHRRLLNHDKYASMSNVTILVHGVKIHSFRAILETRFPLFFKSDIIKKKRERKQHIHVTLKDDPNIDAAVVLQLLDYIYTGELDFNKHTVSMTLQVLYAASIVHLDRLAWLCEHFLHSSLSLQNVYEMYVISDRLKLKSVKKFCTAFAHNNWPSFSASKRGLDTLGLDLFQELTISVSKKETIDLSFLDQAAPNSTLEQDLRNMFTTMKYSDAVAELTDGKTIQFHRAILAAHDRAFFNTLNSQKETKTFKFPVDSETFSCLLRYVYYGGTGDVKVHNAAEVIGKLLPKYPLPKYREICEDVLTVGLTLETVLEILQLTYLRWNTERKKLTSLRKDCLLFIASNFAEVNVPSIRDMDENIAFDLLELMYDEPTRVLRKKEKIRRNDTPVHMQSVAFA